MSDSNSTSHQRVRLAGMIVIVVGLIAAAIVYFSAGAEDPVDAGEHQREMQQLARLNGTAGVQTAEFDAWLSSLWHGERLAYTLAILSLAIGGACFYIGGLMSETIEE